MPARAKDYRRIVRHLRDLGWTVQSGTRTGHDKVVGPTGGPSIPVAGTPGDRRSLANFVAELRRAGVDWPPTEGRKP